MINPSSKSLVSTHVRIEVRLRVESTASSMCMCVVVEKTTWGIDYTFDATGEHIIILYIFKHSVKKGGFETFRCSLAERYRTSNDFCCRQHGGYACCVRMFSSRVGQILRNWRGCSREGDQHETVSARNGSILDRYTSIMTRPLYV